MVRYSFTIGCRNCHQTDGMDHVFNHLDVNEDYYYDVPEFEISKKFKQTLLEQHKRCFYCGSSNIEVNDIRAGNYKLYDVDYLVKRSRTTREEMFQLSVNKDIFGIECGLGGSRKIDPLFQSYCFDILINHIDNIPLSNFVRHPKGMLFICITGIREFLTQYKNIKIERFIFFGFEQKELLNVLKIKYKEL